MLPDVLCLPHRRFLHKVLVAPWTAKLGLLPSLVHGEKGQLVALKTLKLGLEGRGETTVGVGELRYIVVSAFDSAGTKRKHD